MRRLYPLFLLIILAGPAVGQQQLTIKDIIVAAPNSNRAPLKKAPANYLPEPYGVVDTADLKMTSCDFEKEANAEILFDKGTINVDYGKSMERHVRIKILSESEFSSDKGELKSAYFKKRESLERKAAKKGTKKRAK